MYLVGFIIRICVYYPVISEFVLNKALTECYRKQQVNMCIMCHIIIIIVIIIEYYVLTFFSADTHNP